MHQLLELGMIVKTEDSQAPCRVEQFLGGGGQGEVYRALLDHQPIALKWYFPHYLEQDSRLRERLQIAIRYGPWSWFDLILPRISVM
jgi:eukaryotic-like serine/threonine-protein kinase